MQVSPRAQKSEVDEDFKALSKGIPAQIVSNNGRVVGRHNGRDDKSSNERKTDVAESDAAGEENPQHKVDDADAQSQFRRQFCK